MQHRLSASFVVALGGLLWASACATGGGTGGEGGEGTGAGPGVTSASSSASQSSSDASSVTASSSSGAVMCGTGEHVCGGVCVGNTPVSGCYQSTTCAECVPPLHGTSMCTNDGLCDFTCEAPYQKQTASCVCPMECCSVDDCPSGDSCENGSCVTPCDAVECLATCVFMGFSFGTCSGNDCQCTN